jgi:hypothetical protein
MDPSEYLRLEKLRHQQWKRDVLKIPVEAPVLNTYEEDKQWCLREFHRITERRLSRTQYLTFWEEMAGLPPLTVLPCGETIRRDVSHLVS